MLVCFCCYVWLITVSAEAHYQAIPLDGFTDMIKHWRDRTGDIDKTHYTAEQIVEIADNLLLYQRNNGGWPTNKDPLRIVSAEERQKAQQDKIALDSSFDNRNTYPQIEYLAYVYQQTGNVTHRDAVLHGIEFVLSSQYDNGGWAHSPPSTQGYRAHITFMDDVMPGVLSFLRLVAAGQAPFDFIDKKIRKRAVQAVKKGDALVLQLQIVVDGRPTVWAGQYDRQTLQPVEARAYELPGLVSWESVQVVRYLMSIAQPSKQVIYAVESAKTWYETSTLHGFRVEQIPTEPVKFDYYTSTYDLQIVEDSHAPAIWARFYEIGSNKPFMANRDGSKVYTLADVARERRTGYTWYGDWPATLLTVDYPAWRDRMRK